MAKPKSKVKKVVPLALAATFMMLLGAKNASAASLVLDHSDVGITSACSYYRLVDTAPTAAKWLNDMRTLNITALRQVYGTLNDITISWRTNQTMVQTIENCTSIEKVVDHGNGWITNYTDVCKPYNVNYNSMVWEPIVYSMVQDSSLKSITVSPNLVSHLSESYSQSVRDGYLMVSICGTYSIEKTIDGYGVSIDHVPAFLGTEYEQYAWWNASWSYSKNISLYSDVATDELVIRNLTLDTATLVAAGKMKNDCSDLRFVNDTGVEIPFYIETGCNKADTVIKVLTVTKSDNTSMAIAYYGNAAANDGQNRAGVVTSYQVYYDMGSESGTTLIDVAGYTNATLSNGGWTTGVMGNASTYSGTGSGAGTTKPLSQATYYGEGWFYVTNASGNNPGIASLGSYKVGNDTRQYINAKVSVTGCSNLLAHDVIPGGEVGSCWNILPPASWNFYSWQFNGTRLFVYRNGTLIDNDAKTYTPAREDFYIMKHIGGTTDIYGGMADEVGVRNSTVTANFIKLRYDSMTNPSLVSAWSAESGYVAPYVPPNPIAAPIIVCFKTQPVCVRLSDFTVFKFNSHESIMGEYRV